MHRIARDIENDIVEDRDGGEEDVIEAPVLPLFGGRGGERWIRSREWGR